MRIELADPWGFSRLITSQNPRVLGLWLQDILDEMEASRSSFQSWYLKMWAETESERQAINGNTYSGQASRSQLEKLAKPLITFKGKGTKNMSEVGWCDYRDHAYKRDAENENVLTIKGETKEICPECAAELGLIDEYEAPPNPAERKAMITKAIGNGK